MWLIFRSVWLQPPGEPRQVHTHHPGAVEVVNVILLSYEGLLLAVIPVLWAVQDFPHHPVG